MRIIYPTPIRKCRSIRISDALERFWFLIALVLCFGAFAAIMRSLPYLIAMYEGNV